jgi:hypothetical protein
MCVVKMKYDIGEHRHRFSVWAAARAAQRGFTTVENLRLALEHSGVLSFLTSAGADIVNADDFDELHRSWCRAITARLADAKVQKVTFGRAAKLLAVYLKSVVVLGAAPDSNLGKVAHPPIDAILLSNLVKSPVVVSEHKVEWATVRWTRLDEGGYYRLIEQLRSVLAPGEPFWMLERYWTVTDEIAV